ncbi:GTPase SAR1 [Ectothiorhodospira haloalkaliphila]|uniref:GTPase SAR1 n=1 Tax=Ectothiorhodospira haloalkaliphila TaxID=421628 RepID=W8KQT5_9GAMM|nr:MULTISPECIES: GTPase/DUF3482 domain-containing protein [Ectothiorhodospira]AHK79377.1 GTPase SAR1 [Ectothiorhodospira haloalkaliphila]MCG5494878.1 GTPase/DUF3482 domain-containing protein [Ectothiorhodospira variabilis]MCG5497717.1 GTPase/DUF3482 domain-containing protein [Ectothiorhodospira variabilis]MCG5504391.1 GTPase/DUF3482 domain-containing protein [Ectothiorhodospira variabilis]MCG5507546.1 GTPase/DUF3482 domain-containing protein [Ectothiorhodospira variabilis]
MSPLLQVAVVGHTNTGKTSLLRTLSRDTDFGEVCDAPATTRHVEGTEILVDGGPVMALFDTPGLEDASGILDWLETGQQDRHAGAEALERFLQAPEASGRFEQESKVLRQLRSSDVGLYVIDAREPVLGKYRDELAVLGMCARPLIPVLNFVASQDNREPQWRETLANLGLHAVITFDSVVYDLQGELRLHEKLRSLLDAYREPLGRLMEARTREAQWLERSAAESVADMLLDIAACTLLVPREPAATEAGMEELQRLVRRREQDCVDALLSLYRFRASDYLATQIPLEDGQWGMDLFTTDALRHYGLRTSEGAAVGGAIGLAIDVMALGTTLGAGTAAGATAGALMGNGVGLGRRLGQRMRGQRELRVNDTTLRLLALRQRQLARALSRRGHGAEKALELNTPTDNTWRRGKLPAPVRKARLHPRWSRLNERADGVESKPRAQALEALTEQLLDEGSRV